MTVSSSTNKVSFSGNGTLTTFAYSFKIFDQDDLTVILRAANGTETTQTITTHYTVTGVGSASGGNVVFGTAPASGVTVVIIREQPLTQGLDLVPNDPFPAQSLEESLDKLTFMAQKHEEELSRAIKGSRTNVIANSEFTVSATDRANKVFAFDGSGNLSITQELGTFKGNWAASTSYVERDLVKDTTTNNVFIVNAAHTSSGSQPLTTNTNSSKYEKIIDITNPPGNFSVGGNLAVTGSVTGASFVIGSADINENDLEAIDGVTAGTVAASKAVVVDVNKDISSFRNLTASGIVNYGSLSDGSITVTAFVDEDNMASNSATLIPTQQSVKAYVDSQVGASDTLTEILGNGNTTSGTNIQLTTTDEVQFRDTALKISSSADGQLDIDADTEVEITAPTVDINASTEVNISGDLTVDTNTLHVDSSNNRVGIKTTSPDNELTVIGTGFFGASTAGVGLSNSGADLALISGQTPSGTYKPLKISSTDPSSNYLYFDTTSGIGINNDSPSSFNSKLVIGATSGSNTMTIASGTTGVGNIHFADGTSGDALDAGYIRYHHQYDRLVLGTASATVEPLRITSSGSVGIKIAGDPSTELEVNGTITGTGFASTGNMTFGDDNKAIFGAGSDLQIYHTGSTSIIKEGGTGDLLVQAQNFYVQNVAGTQSNIYSIDGGATGIGYAGAVKLATTSTGIDVTGTVTADGLTVESTGEAAALFKGYTSVTGGNSTINGEILLGNNANFQGRISYEGATQGFLYIENSYNNDAADIVFRSKSSGTAKNNLLIEGNGDISFYEDTGTTAKLFWDASAESLGIGTSSPISPLHINVGTNQNLRVFTSNSTPTIASLNDANSAYAALGYTGSQHEFRIGTTEHMRIDSSGRLLLGTTDVGYTGFAEQFTLAASGNSGITIRSGSTSTGRINFSDGTGNTSAQFVGNIVYDHSANSMNFGTDSTERMRIDSSGNVGIGTSSPDSFGSGRTVVDITGSTGGYILTDDGTTQSRMGSEGGVGYLGTRTNHPLAITTNNTERMRIDSSGNFLVGTTAYTGGSSTTQGGGFLSTGTVFGTRDGNEGGIFNRLTSDGDIVAFRKDGSTVGSIGTTGGDLTIFSATASHGGIRFAQSGLLPTDNTGALSDATRDIGQSDYRWKDLYLSGGVYLGGTGSANKLDDYEEGTTDPLDVSGASLTLASGTIGSYTRVGNIVNFQAKLVFPSTSNTSEARITLPFVVSDRSNHYPTGANGANGTTAASHCLAIQGQSYIVFQPTSGATTSTNANLSGANINLNITYQTTP